jgi:D-apiose dehydrogenase
MIYRGAIIGCGYIAPRQLAAWKQIRGCEIVAVCDLDAGRAERCASEFGIPSVYTDYRQLLEQEQLHFVDIATRPASHLALAAAAAARGLHVLCQKPLANMLAEARQIVAVCQQAGVSLMVNEMWRHLAWYRKIRALLAAGAIGQPYYARFYGRSRNSLPTTRFDGQEYFQSMERLIVFEQGVHYLDTARYLFGAARQVYAQIRRISPHIAGDDTALLQVTFDNVACLIDMSWCSLAEPKREKLLYPFRVEGTGGLLSLREDGHLACYTDDATESWQFPADTYEQSFVAAQSHFLDCLAKGREPETSGAETLKTMELVFSAYLSAETGRAVELPLQ